MCARLATRRSWRFGVSVLLSPTVMVESDGLQVGGYFDGDRRLLAVGVVSAMVRGRWQFLLTVGAGGLGSPTARQPTDASAAARPGAAPPALRSAR